MRDKYLVISIEEKDETQELFDELKADVQKAMQINYMVSKLNQEMIAKVEELQGLYEEN